MRTPKASDDSIADSATMFTPGFPHSGETAGGGPALQATGLAWQRRFVLVELGSVKTSGTLQTRAGDGMTGALRCVLLLIWGGAEEAWIDHAFAFGVGERASLLDENKLCRMVMHAGEREELAHRALAMALAIVALFLVAIASSLLGSDGWTRFSVP